MVHMLAWLVVGAAFGAAAGWGAYVGLYDALTETRGQSLRRLPRTFWRRSLIVALCGAVAGTFLMWRALAGADVPETYYSLATDAWHRYRSPASGAPHQPSS